MLMEQVGIQVQEKEFTFTTPQVHGLSYKLLNPKSKQFKANLAKCYNFIDRSAKASHSVYNLPTDTLVKRCIEQHCDTWVSTRDDKIVGCFTVGVAVYDDNYGINIESTSGKFVYEDVVPTVEKFYKELGYKFVEISGRKGWERVFKPLGYNLSRIIIHKEI
jgi:hypothetical protein